MKKLWLWYLISGLISHTTWHVQHTLCTVIASTFCFSCVLFLLRVFLCVCLLLILAFQHRYRNITRGSRLAVVRWCARASILLSSSPFVCIYIYYIYTFIYIYIKSHRETFAVSSFVSRCKAHMLVKHTRFLLLVPLVRSLAHVTSSLAIFHPRKISCVFNKTRHDGQKFLRSHARKTTEHRRSGPFESLSTKNYTSSVQDHSSRNNWEIRNCRIFGDCTRSKLLEGSDKTGAQTDGHNTSDDQ